jgi:hypothetical protein
MTATQPQSISLSEADIKDTCSHATETKRLLLHAFDNASAEQQSELEPNLKDLQSVLTLYELISAIRMGLKKTKSLDMWFPKGHIEQIVRACCNQRYREHDIECILYEHGDINGLLVFHLGTKSQTTLFPKTYALPREMIVGLAKQCKKEVINKVIPGWITRYDRTKSTIAFFVPQQTFCD